MVELRGGGSGRAYIHGGAVDLDLASTTPASRLSVRGDAGPVRTVHARRWSAQFRRPTSGRGDHAAGAASPATGHRGWRRFGGTIDRARSRADERVGYVDPRRGESRRRRDTFGPGELEGVALGSSRLSRKRCSPSGGELNRDGGRGAESVESETAAGADVRLPQGAVANYPSTQQGHRRRRGSR